MTREQRLEAALHEIAERADYGSGPAFHMRAIARVALAPVEEPGALTPKEMAWATNAARESLKAQAEPKTEQLGDYCKVPPTGWYCSREVGHSGPCAAYLVSIPPPATAPRTWSIEEIEEALVSDTRNWDEEGFYNATLPRVRAALRALK